tara:strand:+ start:4694 stop:5056 length:363 start_codon:yes stop_codon:yes gene_type:complete
MNPSNFETVVPLSVAAIAFAGFINGFFICLFGIKVMDKFLSKLPDYRRESASPFDRFERMHKYSFGYILARNKRRLGIPMRAWLYLTALGLSAYWFVFAAAAMAYFFNVDPITIISFGLS